MDYYHVVVAADWRSMYVHAVTVITVITVITAITVITVITSPEWRVGQRRVFGAKLATGQQSTWRPGE
ncbi:hypothetical protein E4U59_003065 [Claviceps monticola]|nr:hypothetical protein E4U59_003065 [Claviceps monticola]